MTKRRDGGDEPMKTVYSLHEFDVLCGRGNGANNRRGNIEFRMHVEKLKGVYAVAKREDKMRIAEKIVRRVHAKGGKFLKFKGEIDEKVYLQIGFHRSCIKCCQALRENREGRSKTPNQVLQLQRALEKFASMQSKQASPTEKEVQVRTPKVKNTQKRKPPPTRAVTIRRSTLWQVSGRDLHSSSQSANKSLTSEDETVENVTSLKVNNSVKTDDPPPERSHALESDTCSGSGKFIDSDESSSESSTVGQNESTHPERQECGALVHRLMAQGPAPTNVPDRVEPSGWFCDFMSGGTSDATSPSNQACFESLFRSLVQFKEVHGHCAIPPSAGSPHAGSSKEEREFARLADWASVQRCLGRVVRSGRKIPTEEERNRLIRLAKLGFVFDYEEWHWNKKYDELVRFQREERNRRHTSGRPSIGFSKSLGLALWIKEQRHLYEQGSLGKIYKMRRDRLAKLERLNFCWATRDKNNP